MDEQQEQEVFRKHKKRIAELNKQFRRKLSWGEEQEILEAMPEYQQMVADRERVKKEMTELFKRDQQPLVEALTQAGWPAEVRQCGPTRSVWDLANTAVSYPHLIDVLIDHFTRPYHIVTREGIARALTVKEARGTKAQDVLVAELKKLFKESADPGLGYPSALINALGKVGDSSVATEVQHVLETTTNELFKPHLARLLNKLQRRKAR